jgi:transcriptional regulator with XRE-family HTH domain
MMAHKSQEDLAKHLGVSFQQVQKYENGKNRLSAATLYSLAGYLNVPVSHFFSTLPPITSDGKEAVPANELTVALHSPEVQKLIKAFTSIKGPASRKIALESVRMLAGIEKAHDGEE